MSGDQKILLSYRPSRSTILNAIVVLLIVLLFAAGLAGTQEPHWLKDGEPGDWGPPHEQTARTLMQVLLDYAVDNHGKFPEGNSSTEIFQTLIDQNYISDPGLVYYLLPGKTKGVAGQSLKPQNVCWDLTDGVNMTDSDDLPVVFGTGWKVTYMSGGAAIPRSSPPPQLEFDFTTKRLICWVPVNKLIRRFYEGVPVAYKNQSTRLRGFEYRDEYGGYRRSEGVIINFVPKTFDPKGRKYRQLTPDGPM